LKFGLSESGDKAVTMSRQLKSRYGEEQRTHGNSHDGKQKQANMSAEQKRRYQSQDI
jgi:hypothetical protein